MRKYDTQHVEIDGLEFTVKITGRFEAGGRHYPGASPDVEIIDAPAEATTDQRSRARDRVAQDLRDRWEYEQRCKRYGRRPVDPNHPDI